MHPETVGDLMRLAARRGVTVETRPDWLLGYPIYEAPSVAPGKLLLICSDATESPPKSASLTAIVQSMMRDAGDRAPPPPPGRGRIAALTLAAFLSLNLGWWAWSWLA
ncbi:hypothetical protein HL653_14295 [Sphingomonas sp. AP4-R1]|uniref:hypothetical protein n=1 Tax=Sphingomonas sp. AP4-R1 TaxID=2735134 RepID=UPI001493428F|nr:hypothetical protein [Sphingomonas sp. AP4-R1]QJU58780.1 hypothetical protein HL653_14295 [Sphingomonas sp. AP4-R1]